MRAVNDSAKEVFGSSSPTTVAVTEKMNALVSFGQQTSDMSAIAAGQVGAYKPDNLIQVNSVKLALQAFSIHRRP